jgi:hypothetical protein
MRRRGLADVLFGAFIHPAFRPHSCDEDCRSCGTCYVVRGIEVCSRLCPCAQAEEDE